mgnify:CR=1 FL=1
MTRKGRELVVRERPLTMEGQRVVHPGVVIEGLNRPQGFTQMIHRSEDVDTNALSDTLRFMIGWRSEGSRVKNLVKVGELFQNSDETVKPLRGGTATDGRGVGEKNKSFLAWGGMSPIHRFHLRTCALY